MTNRSKWLVAIPFVFLIAFALPAVLAGEWLWFEDDWAETLFVALTAGMWLVATAFVDVSRPRGPRDRTDILIPLALILAVPVSVIDRLYGPGRNFPSWLSVLGILLGFSAVALGISARLALAQAYQPRATVQPNSQLIRSGPYRFIRHPMYSAAVLWAAGWPLIIGSITGAVVTGLILLPALIARMKREEAGLHKEFGQEYDSYCADTWRMFPSLF